jgi:hypothetical protein
MSEVDRAELLERFKEMTGTTDEFAISFLESSDWKLEPAMELFLGGQGGVARTYSRDSEIVEDLSDELGEDNPDEREILRIMQQHGVDYETAMAIKLAGGSVSSRAPEAAAVDADGVRAPILQKRARLFDTVEQEEAMGYSGASVHGLSGAFDAHLRIAREAMMHGAGGPMRDAPRPSSFAPPHWMMFAGSFEEARNEAKAKKRWLLVNIQHQPEFQSLVLNRDLWSDENIQGLIRESCVFWQQECNSAEGQRFMTLYNPSPPLPHVCVIDPRTGERVKILKLKKQEEELRDAFVDQISDYLDTSALDPVARRQASAASTKTSASTGDSEEKALAAAISASLQVSNQPRQTTEKKADATSAAVAAPKTVKERPKPALPTLEAEPPTGEGSTLIQFKFPDGSRVKRRFKASNSVGMLFAFVASSGKIAQAAGFELMTSEVPARALLADLDKSLVEADVCQQNLLVRLAD